jgi:transcriptional regulator with XRE-family HTH domain
VWCSRQGMSAWAVMGEGLEQVLAAGVRADPDVARPAVVATGAHAPHPESGRGWKVAGDSDGRGPAGLVAQQGARTTAQPTGRGAHDSLDLSEVDVVESPDRSACPGVPDVIRMLPDMMADRGVRGFDPEKLRAARGASRARAGYATGQWTQEHVARLLGVERTNYIGWERGQWSPTPATLARIAELLEVTPAELTSLEEDQATLADLRQWGGWTQQDVAEQLGMSRSWYAALERGDRSVSDRYIESLARLLGRPHEVRGSVEVGDRRAKPSWRAFTQFLP